MIDEKRIVAIIPARGGSKGIKNKNIIDLCGKPLIEYTIDAAKKSKYIDNIVVSTDSEVIAAVATKCGARVPFLRPKEISGDKATTISVIMNVLEYLESKEDEYSIVVLLQPTSPLREYNDIDGALEHFINVGCSSLVSVSLANESPILYRKITDDNGMEKLLDESSTVRRQDMPKIYKVNGAIYINLANDLSLQSSLNDNAVPYIMDKSHSIDIDEPVDLVIAKYYLEGNI